MKLLRRSFQDGLLTMTILIGSGATGLSQTSAVRLSDGSAVHLDDFDITITPPVGWEVLPHYLSKALVMQEPASKEPIKDYSKPLYARNITVALMHEARPIDETEAQTLRSKIEKEFGQAPGVTNFQILEHRLIDYRGKSDGILVYTAFTYNNFQMSQMHILVSGSEKSALLSYTDLSDAFQKDEASMSKAWNSMLSIEVPGQAPRRFANLIPAAAGLGIALVAALCLLLLRRRSARRFIEREEENIYTEGSARSRRSKSSQRHSALSSLAVSNASAMPLSDVWGNQTDAWSTPIKSKTATVSDVSFLA